ncbi:unnamed protein product [Diatraea saccharalis]|uniref:C2H2-type domain-containing protein n=1 Tax=Diatraea saccharalis TaxID=40085 RepID=A0A9N9R4R7_9NEOP|nr:unnamed protein product [Diatraea saccharalis]
MSSTLETEDLDNGPLVRMEDVQPARDRSCDVYVLEDTKDEPMESYVVDHLDYVNECVVDDDDSNIGSMVSIHSQDVVECDDDDSSNSELIVPEVQPVKKKSIKLDKTPEVGSKSPPESWPTLEILPGGVIKRSDKFNDDLNSSYQDDDESENNNQDMMYACAKCSQSFKYLFSLVKHVKGHEKEQKKPKPTESIKPTSTEKELVYLKRARIDLEKSYKKQKVDVLARIADALAQIENVEDFFDK